MEKMTPAIPGQLPLGLERSANVRRNFGKAFVWMNAALTALFAAAPFVAGAEEMEGVWQGFIGTTDVQMCLQDFGSAPIGAYYAVEDGEIVTLEAHASSSGSALTTWEEFGTDENAVLAFTQQGADRLTGTRTTGRGSAEIFLTRVSVLPAEQRVPGFTNCGSHAFSADRLSAEDIVQTIPATWHDVSYTKLLFEMKKSELRLESFQIHGTSTSVQQINTELALGFPTLDPDADVLGCARSNLSWSGRDGLFIQRRWPAFLTGSLLVIATENNIYCGGAYPETSTEWQVMDLEAGEQIDTETWFDDEVFSQFSVAAADDRFEADQAFVKEFMKFYEMSGVDPVCIETLELGSDWVIRPSDQGMIFMQNLPHALQACAVDILMPYQDVWPFLSERGKVTIARFQEVLKTP
jgi:hypothetical protein